MRAALVDSGILIEVSRGRNQSVLAHWDELSRGDAMTLCSPVTVAELWAGVRPQERKLLTEPVIPIDAEIGQSAGGYLNQYAKSHRVELGDALIAATVAIHKVEWWTRNRRHHPMGGITFHE